MNLLEGISDDNAENEVNDTRQQSEKRQLYLCSPKSCHPQVQRREPALPLRWHRPERLPCLSTITPQALRTRLLSARCPHPWSRPAAPCTSGRRREQGHKKERRRIAVMSDCEIQMPTLLEQSGGKDAVAAFEVASPGSPVGLLRQLWWAAIIPQWLHPP